MLILRERLGASVRAIEEQQLAIERAKDEETVALASRLQIEVQFRGMEVGTNPVGSLPSTFLTWTNDLVQVFG